VVLNAQKVSIFFVRASSHGVQSFLRPQVIPVHSTTIDNGRELSAALSKFLTHWGESQHDVEAFSALRYKVVELCVSAVTLSSITSSLFNLFTDDCFLISREEVRNFSRVK
jgi:hypothetical protein